MLAIDQNKNIDQQFLSYLKKQDTQDTRSFSLSNAQTKATGVYPLADIEVLYQQINEFSTYTVPTKLILEGVNFDNIVSQLEGYSTTVSNVIKQLNSVGSSLQGGLDSYNAQKEASEQLVAVTKTTGEYAESYNRFKNAMDSLIEHKKTERPENEKEAAQWDEQLKNLLQEANTAKDDYQNQIDKERDGISSLAKKFDTAASKERSAYDTLVDGVTTAVSTKQASEKDVLNKNIQDGKQEAFGFLGIRNDEYQTWESVKLYYLKSDGSVEKIALNGDVTGGPAKVSGTEQMDFSESFITLGNKTFLDFEIGYSASEPTTVLFGVNDGNYTSTSVYGYFPEKVDENHIATSDLDYRVVYKEENGIFTETMRMPGEDYEYRFASKEEYLNSMLTEEQLKDMARGLGVPEDLDVRYIQGERSYWEAGECWEIYVLVCTGNKCIASCSINPDNGEWTRNTAMYDPDHAWEVNC